MVYFNQNQSLTTSYPLKNSYQKQIRTASFEQAKALYLLIANLVQKQYSIEG
jgi:hypothetical protein